jgi:hypothetical protein
MVNQLVGPYGTPIATNGHARGRPPQPTSVALETGISIWRGTISEEYLPELKPWNRAFKVFQEMEDDAVIGTLYESIIVPLLDSKFDVHPASNAAIDLEVADFIRANTIESESFDWIDHVRDQLEMLSYGFALCEKVLEKRQDGLLWLADLIPIGQETLHSWGPLDDHGRITAFIQQTLGTIPGPSIRIAPVEKLILSSFRPRKRNPMGRAISRALYRPWYFKKNLEVVEAIGAERDVGNVPVAVLGEGLYTSEDMGNLKLGLEGLRIDETSHLIVPHGTEIRPFGSGGKVYDVRGIIRDWAHLIRQRFFMDFVSFGTESVGTQALAKEVTGFFSLALGSIQRELIADWNKQLVPWILQWNNSKFSGRTANPKIVWAKPGKINVQSLAQSVMTLAQGNIIHINKALEDHVREQFELPPITEEEIKELEKLQVQNTLMQQAVIGQQASPGQQPVGGPNPASSVSGGGSGRSV